MRVSPPVSALLAVIAILATVLPGSVAGGTETGALVSGEVLVRLAPGASDDAVPGRHAVRAVPSASSGAISRWWRVTVPAGSESEAAERFQALPAVEVAEPALAREPASNDPLTQRQWYLDDVRARRAWQSAPGSSLVAIGVVDTGFDLGHADLVLHTVDGGRGVTTVGKGCRAGVPNATHGTAVAGIAGALHGNGRGIAGVGGRSTVVAVSAGHEVGGRCLVGSRWVEAIVRLADAGVAVANLSFAGHRPSQMERDAVAYALDRGLLPVAAAGNHGSTRPVYPAAYEGVVAVAAADRDGDLWHRSNRGRWIDVRAPGVDLLTTCGKDRYCRMSGSSAAAPVVAGVAALAASLPDVPRGLRLSNRLKAGGDRTAAPPTLDAARIVTTGAVRLAGPDRYATAAEIGREASPDARSVDTVVLAPGDTPNDAGWAYTLPAAGLLQGGDTALVVTPRGSLSPEAREEIARLLAGERGKIILPGSPSQGVGRGVEHQLAQQHQVVRIDGSDPATVAVGLADLVKREGNRNAALVASTETFADALSLSGAAASHGYPMLFVGRNHVPSATCRWIGSNRSVERLFLAGGTHAISQRVAARLRECGRGLPILNPAPEIIRDAGGTRVETSLAIARRHFGEAPRRVALASAWSWPDAVVGGGLGATLNTPVLLVDGSLVPHQVSRYLGSARLGYVLGGRAVVADTVADAVERSIRRG